MRTNHSKMNGSIKESVCIIRRNKTIVVFKENEEVLKHTGNSHRKILSFTKKVDNLSWVEGGVTSVGIMYASLSDCKR